MITLKLFIPQSQILYFGLFPLSLFYRYVHYIDIDTHRDICFFSRSYDHAVCTVLFPPS